MARLIQWFMLMLLVLPAVIHVSNFGSQGMIASAQEDDLESDEADVVEDEEADGVSDEELEESTNENDIDLNKNVHPNAETIFIFSDPAIYPGAGTVELPGGRVVEFLVGLRNNDPDDNFVVDSAEASFRYPLDFSYHIQNFSNNEYGKSVNAGQEATFFYSMMPSDSFAGRSIGLTVNLNYKDQDGNIYVDSVFNETVQIVEFIEGIDSEIFFMYVFLVGIVLILPFLIYSLLSKSKGKKPATFKPVEMGTANDDVDYEWIPKSALQQNRTPGSNKTSPRQRKSKRNVGSDTE